MKSLRPVFIKQQDETDCGAACLAMITKYYGKRISISKIRNYAGTDIRGTTGKGIVKAAINLGFTCKNLFSNTKQLLSDINVPLIVNVKKNNMEHYLVVYKIKKDKLLIADPALSLFWIKKQEFLKIWTGYFFLFSPTQVFEKLTEDASFLTRFFYLLKENKTIAIQTFISSFILTILGMLSAFYFRFLIDEVIYSYLPIALVTISLLYLVVIIFQTILSYARNHLIIFLSNKMEASLSLEYFSHFLRLPLDFFTKRKSGEILSRFTDIATIKNALSSMCVGVILDCVMLVFTGIVLFAFNTSLTGIAIIPVVLSGVLVLAFSKRFRNLIYTRSVTEAEKYSHFVESVNGIATIKSLSSEADCYDKAEINIIKAIQKGFNLSNLANFQNTLETFLSQSGSLAVYWYGSSLIMKGDLSLGQLISFVTLLGFFLGPLSRLITLQPQLEEISVAQRRLGEILDLPEEQSLNNGKIILKETMGNISIKNLFFSYGTRGATLSDICLDIKQGEKVAFVGPSGSGKTTLIKLILKFYREDKGSISLDGINIKDLDTASYREFFGYVPQEILLFSGTIEENIAFGNHTVTPQQILKAAEDAQALDFISNLEERFQTKVGERGATLSGGERQRIALARILLRKPHILIFDEATSNLDTICENEILQTIDKITKNTTTLIVAHRLSTIKNCDKIFVLSEGKIIETGTHKSLLAKKGLYAKMWKNQNGER